MNSLPLVTIGILVHNGEKYFPYLFPSLFAQDYPNLEVLVLDNAFDQEKSGKDQVETLSPKNGLLRITKITDHTIFPSLPKEWNDRVQMYRSEKNLGFATGHNALINRAKGDYYLCLNQDIILEPDHISRLVETMEASHKIGSVTGKLRKWDFQRGEQGKTMTIDTVGIRCFQSHRFVDIGQGQRDVGQFDVVQEIFCASGAAVLYRKSALESMAYASDSGQELSPPENGVSRCEYFDSDFFMYKEDIDLGYRLRWSGWKHVYTPHAVGYHDRTVGCEKSGLLNLFSEQKRKSKAIKHWSWRNHQMMLKKNFSQDFSAAIRWKTWFYQLLTHVYMLICEPRIFFAVRRELSVLRKKITEKARQRSKNPNARLSLEPLLAGVMKKYTTIARVCPDGVQIDLHGKSSLFVAWKEITKITVITADQGPWSNDLWISLVCGDAEHRIASDALGADGLIERIVSFPGFQQEIFILAMGSGSAGVHVCWES